MSGQSHYDYALFALRGAYIVGHIASVRDAQQIVFAATGHGEDSALDEQAIIELTARCHGTLVREGALEKTPVGEGFVRKAA